MANNQFWKAKAAIAKRQAATKPKVEIIKPKSVWKNRTLTTHWLVYPDGREVQIGQAKAIKLGLIDEVKDDK